MDQGKTPITIFLSLILGVVAYTLWSKTPMGHHITFKQSEILRSDIANISVVPNTFTNLRIYLFAYSVKQTLFWVKLLGPFVASAGLLILAATTFFAPEE